MESFNLIQFYQKFGTEEQCQDFIFKNRWANGVTCPKCGEIDVKTYRLASGRIKCASCRNTFTVRTRSVFEDSPVSLQKWLLAIYLCGSYKKGISSIQLGKFIDVTQKTAWFMLQRIRYVYENDSFELLDGEVEMDEAYIGGSDKYKHHNKKLKTLTGKGAQGFGSKNSKVPVVGMVERGGNLRAIATKDTGSKTLMTLARTHIDINATIYTDEHMPYRTLPKLGFKHESVNHGVKEFVNGMASTNTAESFWSYLKRGINGIYHHVSPKHLQLYCDEYSYRWNTRTMTDGERFEDWFSHVNGRRLTYNTLIRK
ncbi:MAG: IS1595 family transposase [Candidatus Saccharimonadales bacterium]